MGKLTNPSPVWDNHNKNHKYHTCKNRAGTGGKAYRKACRRVRQGIFISTLYWIAGVYALMWAVIIWRGWG